MKNPIELLAEKLPAEIGGVKIDAALITFEPNLFYLTGFPSSEGMLVVLRDKAYLLTDFRYAEAAESRVTNCEVVCTRRHSEMAQELLKKHGAKGVLLEYDTLYLSQARVLEKRLAEIDATAVEDSTLDTLLREMRSIKTPQELQKIRDAQKITDDSFAHILKFIKPGVTEREIAVEIEFFMRRQGAEGVAFDSIVVSGKNGSLCHGVPSDKRLESGDFITMDIGAKLNGYCSDMTRTVALGQVSEEQRHVYDLVLKGQLAAIDAAKPGVLCGDVDKAARDILEAEYPGTFGHSTGHAVGVEIHEWPYFRAGSKDTAKPGMLMTVEPGIYLAGKFGVRIEDMIVITEKGCEDLTHSPKELMIL